MALVLNTNCGFVTVAPTNDPTGTNISPIDGYALAQKDVAPVGAIKITEIGWYTGENTNGANYELGLYSHNAGGEKPDARLEVSTGNAKGTTKGWKKVTVDWTIVAGTTYWLALQVDAVSDATYMDRSSSGGKRYIMTGGGQTALESTWPAGGSTVEYIIAIYAVWEEAAEEYVDITGTITGTSSLSGTLTLIDIVPMTGTITGTSALSGELTLSSNWQTDNFITIKRLIVIGSDSLYYEVI
jgi:hypothetical protein